MKEILYDTATTETGYGRFLKAEFHIKVGKQDTDKDFFQEELENQKLKKGKVKKVWEKPRFERKCK